ncbi:MAG: hypothetical protein IIV48_08350, partial [Clostridium sp.]|nr:hypothetical protein [Clostridium sp.]
SVLLILTSCAFSFNKYSENSAFILLGSSMAFDDSSSNLSTYLDTFSILKIKIPQKKIIYSKISSEVNYIY